MDNNQYAKLRTNMNRYRMSQEDTEDLLQTTLLLSLTKDRNRTITNSFVHTAFQWEKRTLLRSTYSRRNRELQYQDPSAFLRHEPELLIAAKQDLKALVSLCDECLGNKAKEAFLAYTILDESPSSIASRVGSTEKSIINLASLAKKKLLSYNSGRALLNRMGI